MQIKKILIILFVMLLLLTICTINKSYAILQSNGREISSKSIPEWMTQIRNMEQLGGRFRANRNN